MKGKERSKDELIRLRSENDELKAINLDLKQRLDYVTTLLKNKELSETKIKKLKRKGIFEDSMCPKCGKELKVSSITLLDGKVREWATCSGKGCGYVQRPDTRDNIPYDTSRDDDCDVSRNDE